MIDLFHVGERFFFALPQDHVPWFVCCHKSIIDSPIWQREDREVSKASTAGRGLSHRGAARHGGTGRPALEERERIHLLVSAECPCCAYEALKSRSVE